MISQTTGSSRIPEFLEGLKSEFESLVHDRDLYKMQKDEYERKLQSQLGELSNIQQTLFELERNQAKIKQQYEEEIMRLRRQIELGGVGTPAAPSNTTPSPFGSGMGLNMPNPQVNMNNLGMSMGLGTSIAPVRSLQNPPTNPTSNNIPPLSVVVSPNTAPQNNQPPRPPMQNLMDKNGTPLDKQRQPFPVPPQTTQPTTPIAPLAPAVSLGAPTLPAVSTVPPGPPKRNRDESAVQLVDTSAMNINQQPPKQQKSDRENVNINSSPEFEEKPKFVDRRSGIETSDKKDDSGIDWIVGYNPGVQTNLNIDLMSTLEHSSVVCCVRFSNDGKYLASGCNKSAQIYDVETGEKAYTFSEDIGKDGDLYIRSVCFSPDNKYLACGAEDHTVKVWDVENKRLHHTFVGHELDIYSLDFSRDGNLIVSGSGDKKAKIWDLEKGECLFTLGNEEVGPKDGVTSVAFSPDGRLVAAGSLDRIVRLWDAQTGFFLERYEGHLDSVYSVAFSPDGKSLASGSLDKTLKLWDLAGSRSRSRCRSTFTGHKDFVLSVAFSPDGNWLISGSKDRSVQFWDPRSAVTHMMLQGHKNSVISVAVSPTGKHFATGSGDFRARLWSLGYGLKA